jgi:hypothetical protein
MFTPTLVKPYNQVEVNDAFFQEIEEFHDRCLKSDLYGHYLRFLNINKTKPPVGNLIYKNWDEFSPGRIIASYSVESWVLPKHDSGHILPIRKIKKPQCREVCLIEWLHSRRPTLNFVDDPLLRLYQPLIDEYGSKLTKHETLLSLLKKVC